MRAIKFRAWLPCISKMTHAGTIEDITKWATLGCTPIWLQFTGLKDKNGKDIYEGDVIKYMPRFGDKYRVEQVYWQDFRAGFATKRSEHANNDLYHAVNYGNECTIIGNIYESPDLLTK